jgi:hypothetical protein
VFERTANTTPQPHLEKHLRTNYTRQGYFADKAFARFTSADKERQLEEALMLENPVTDIAMAIEVNYSRLNRALGQFCWSYDRWTCPVSLASTNGSSPEADNGNLGTRAWGSSGPLALFLRRGLGSEAEAAETPQGSELSHGSLVR